MGQKKPPLSPTDRLYLSQSSWSQRQQWRQREYAESTCWTCDKIGCVRRQFPLNFNRPAQRVDGWTRP